MHDFLAENYLTNYASLRELVGDYNGRLSEAEVAYTVDQGVVTVRDALAHGRLISQTPTPPVTLYKFGKPSESIVPIELVEELTKAWLSEKVQLTHQQVLRVTDCARARGHSWVQ